MTNTPELRDHCIGHSSNDLETTRRVVQLGRENAPELRDHRIGILIKHRRQTEFYASLKNDTKECAFAAQEVHTYPKSHHELNIWQRISPLKLRVLQARLTPASRKASLNQDKSTYTSGEQEQLIELSSFSMCSTLQS
jgi:hypothetical protein